MFRGLEKRMQPPVPSTMRDRAGPTRRLALRDEGDEAVSWREKRPEEPEEEESEAGSSAASDGPQPFSNLANPSKMRRMTAQDFEDALEDDLGEEEEDGEEGDEEEDGDLNEPYADDLGLDSDVAAQAAKIRAEKMDLLRKLNDLAAKGHAVPSDLSMKTHIDVLRMEYNSIQRQIGLKTSIRVQRRLLMMAVSGLEWANRTYDPISAKLDGWSEHVYSQLDDYNGVMERYVCWKNAAPPMKEAACTDACHRGPSGSGSRDFWATTYT